MEGDPDYKWIIEQLESFIRDTVPCNLSSDSFLTVFSGPSAPEDRVIAQAEIVEQIFERFYPQWRSVPEDETYDWARHREAAQRCLVQLTRGDEIRARLGASGPRLSASSLHEKVWMAAASLWDSKHYRQAVEAAAQSVNAYAQDKVGRRDVSESDLFIQSFSDDRPVEGKPRLRHPEDDGKSKTASSLRRGIRDFSAGCYAAIRNPSVHGDPSKEIPEHLALEHLAAFSILARWVEAATVERPR